MLLKLFFTFMIIGTFSFGGGNAMYPLLSQELISNHGWLTEPELIDLFALAQMTPGPIATNAATFVGYKIAGVPGAVLSTVGVSLPSFIIMFVFVRLLVSFYESKTLKSILAGLKPAIVALILAAGVIIGRQSINDIFGVILVIANIIAYKYFNLHPILLIFCSGIIAVLIY